MDYMVHLENNDYQSLVTQIWSKPIVKLAAFCFL